VRASLVLLIPLLGCPTVGGDDDDATPRVEIVDDDDDSTDPLEDGTPVSVPGSFTVDCAESEPNDAPVFAGTTNTADPPWDDATDCGAIGGTGAVLGMTGRIDRLVQNSWEGDTDTFVFTVDAEMTAEITLQWDPLQGDFDARVWCPVGTSWVDAADSGLATASSPEQAEAGPISAGDSCYVIVAGYAGPVADYTIWLEVD